MMRRLAQPGDVDLDLDLDGVGIDGVVVEGGEILIHFTGGCGIMKDMDTGKIMFVDNEVEGDMRAEMDDHDSDWFRFLCKRLFDWRDRRVPVRICSAPHRITTIIEDNDSWVPLPRRNNPNWPRG